MESLWCFGGLGDGEDGIRLVFFRDFVILLFSLVKGVDFSEVCFFGVVGDIEGF